MKLSKLALAAFSPELKPVNIHSIRETLRYLRNHHNIIEQMFTRDFDALCEEARDEDELMEEETNQFGEAYISDSWMLAKNIDFIHIRMHRYSSILSLYSILEKTMKSICLAIESESDSKIRCKDLKGEGIKVYYTYLKKVCDFPLDEEMNNEWSNIQTLKDIRNCITHNAGDVSLSDNSDKLIKHFKKVPNVFFIEKHLLNVKEEYITEAVNFVEQFLIYLLEYKKNRSDD